MAKINVSKNKKGGKEIRVNDKLIDDVVSATIYITEDNCITINIEIRVDEADIQE